MPLWGKNDVASNTPLWIANQLNKSLTSDNVSNSYNNVTAGIYTTNVAKGVFAVSAREISVLKGNNQINLVGNASPTHSGWVLRTVGTGSRAGRVHFETLVAGGDIVGDGADNTWFPNTRIGFVSSPSSNVWNRGNAVNMIVIAGTEPGGQSITYQWQQDQGNAVLTWANVANAGTFASANGNTSDTLSIANNLLVTGNNFRVAISTAFGNTQYSANALITTT